MSALPDPTRRLRLEALETRTLLAADMADPFGLTADFNLAMHAVAGAGDFHGSFSTNWGNHQLVITGDANTSLTIDLNQLPSFITNLEITSVGSVTMTGTDHLDNLILTSIGSVAADGLVINHSVVASDVGSISLASIGSDVAQDVAYLSGSSTDLSVRSLDNATIITGPDLQTLTLWSETKTPSVIVRNPELTLNLKYLPDGLGLSGIPRSSIHVVLPPVDDGHSSPDSPPVDNGVGGTAGPGSNPLPGGSTDTPPDSGPDPITIVTIPLDERTRAFIDQIDQLLHSAHGDASEQIFDLIAHRDNIDTAEPAITAERSLPAIFALDQNAHSAAPLVAAAHFAPNSPVQTKSVERKMSPDLFLTEGETPLFVEAAEPSSSHLPDGLVASDLMQVEVSWPLAFPPVGVRPTAAASKASSGEHEHSIADSARALGGYIVERVTAEFSPGQQSLVLLVDPQPTRIAGSNKKSLSERLALASQIPLLDGDAAIAVV